MNRNRTCPSTSSSRRKPWPNADRRAPFDLAECRLTSQKTGGASGIRTPDLFHAMPAPLGVLVRFNGWRESVTVQASRPFDRVEVAHLVAQRPKPRTGLLDGSSG